MVCPKVMLSEFTLLALACLASACTGIAEAPASATSSPTPSSYDCTYFGHYNNIIACQAATAVVCSYGTETFPNGVTSVCYYPPAGTSGCASSPPSWVYSQWGSWCTLSNGAGYERQRSVVACSSTICSCNDTPVIQQTCSSPAGDCAVASASPNPATASPTPASCP